MPIFLLDKNEIAFPPPHLADEQGVIAVGGDLRPQRLLLAYQLGIFPWYSKGEPIMWWTPDPRFVLFPEDLKVSKSMRPYFNQQKFIVTADQHFQYIIDNCSKQPRKGQTGTWITKEMKDAYIQLHELGFAHSIEIWQDHEIVGGLYGISLGKVFFGESMFTKVSNASKFGFISLVKKLKALDFWLIDCQQETRHLKSLGANSISRNSFQKYLKKNESENTLQGNWGKLFDLTT